jgi:hypothetical protein
MGKQAFMQAMEMELRVRYGWAADEARLAKFLTSVRQTLDGGMTWNKDGDAGLAAWRAIGGKGKPTYKALQALPE